VEDPPFLAMRVWSCGKIFLVGGAVFDDVWGAILGPFFGPKNEAAFRPIIRGGNRRGHFWRVFCGRFSALKLGPRRSVFA